MPVAARRGLLLLCAVVLAKAGAAGEQAVRGVRSILRRHGRARACGQNTLPGPGHHRNRFMMEATWTKARKLRPVFSSRVATRRYCLTWLKNRCTRLRSLEPSAS